MRLIQFLAHATITLSHVKKCCICTFKQITVTFLYILSNSPFTIIL